MREEVDSKSLRLEEKMITACPWCGWRQAFTVTWGRADGNQAYLELSYKSGIHKCRVPSPEDSEAINLLMQAEVMLYRLNGEAVLSGLNEDDPEYARDFPISALISAIRKHLREGLAD